MLAADRRRRRTLRDLHRDHRAERVPALRHHRPDLARHDRRRHARIRDLGSLHQQAAPGRAARRRVVSPRSLPRRRARGFALPIALAMALVVGLPRIGAPDTCILAPRAAFNTAESNVLQRCVGRGGYAGRQSPTAQGHLQHARPTRAMTSGWQKPDSQVRDPLSHRSGRHSRCLRLNRLCGLVEWGSASIDLSRSRRLF